jgi:hypothetical protein
LDSESSDNKLLFNEKKKNVFKGLSESCEIPKKNVGTKKTHKNKLDNKDNKLKIKNQIFQLIILN